MWIKIVILIFACSAQLYPMKRNPMKRIERCWYLHNLENRFSVIRLNECRSLKEAIHIKEDWEQHPKKVSKMMVNAAKSTVLFFKQKLIDGSIPKEEGL